MILDPQGDGKKCLFKLDIFIKHFLPLPINGLAYKRLASAAVFTKKTFLCNLRMNQISCNVYPVQGFQDWRKVYKLERSALDKHKLILPIFKLKRKKIAWG
jgi:hypothetical protein